MINKYEAHIETKHTLYEFLNKLKDKGLGIDFILKDGDCGELQVKFPSTPNIDYIDFKFYKYKDGKYIYELGGKSKECLLKIEEIDKMLNS